MLFPWQLSPFLKEATLMKAKKSLPGKSKLFSLRAILFEKGNKYFHFRVISLETYPFIWTGKQWRLPKCVDWTRPLLFALLYIIKTCSCWSSTMFMKVSSPYYKGHLQLFPYSVLCLKLSRMFYLILTHRTQPVLLHLGLKYLKQNKYNVFVQKR